MQNNGIERSFVTLHVGPGTFKPVLVDDIRSQPMHTEEFWVEPTAAEEVNRTEGKIML